MSLIADIFLVSMVDDSGNIICTSTLQDGNIDVAVKENEVRGGRNDQLLAILHSGRDINISLTDAEFRWDWLQKQFGATATVGAAVAWAPQKWYTAVNATGTIKITLDQTPLTSNSGLKLFKSDGTPIALTTGYTISGAIITLVSGVLAGDKVDVRGYKYNTPALTETISIDNTVFADGVILVLETLQIANDESPEFKLQYIFDECLPVGNFTISTTSARTASAQKFDLKVIKPLTTDVVGKVLRIPLS